MKIIYFKKIRSSLSRLKGGKNKSHLDISQKIISVSQKSIHELFSELQSSPNGLTHSQAERRLEAYGFNIITNDQPVIWPVRLLKIFINPLNLLLVALTAISYFTGDVRSAAVISCMVALGVIIRFFQETQAHNAAEALQAMVKTTCTVIRGDKAHEVALSRAVPGDIVQLAAGDIVPADVRLISSKDLFINQSLLTGESLAVEKHAQPLAQTNNALDLQNVCFMGTNVETGVALALIIATGPATYLGSLAKTIVGQRQTTEFDRGIDKFTFLMLKLIAIMVPLVFIINGLNKGNWWEAFLFAVSVAVGLTPEMLPALVSVNLSKGAISLSKKKVIVKRLSSIQNFGAMDVLCTDKTGTLTQNKVVLVKNLNLKGAVDESVVRYAYLNSFYQTGFKNLLDGAILKHVESTDLPIHHSSSKQYKKVDELPFDFIRRRLSVIVADAADKQMLICKGAVEEVVSICTHYSLEGKNYSLTEESRKEINQVNTELALDGFRVIVVATRALTAVKSHYSKKDEHNLTFVGFMAFLDPPKESAAEAITQLNSYGVSVKVLTGDNELVTKKICKEVGLEASNVILGEQIESASDDALLSIVEANTIFARLAPEHKARIVRSLQANHHVVGFLGDGINDAPALRASDIGISVDTAVDIAKESADIILLKMSLLVLKDGILEGRRVFGNIIKYIKMGASSNFGNIFSVLGASIMLPFLPMLPLQLLTNNLLYDISQTGIPTDTVDEEYIQKPRKWAVHDIKRFILCIGPISSLFDYITFALLWFLFRGYANPALFQTGWFVESLLTQTLIVHVIRSRKIPFFQTKSSTALRATTILIMLIGIYLPFSSVAPTLHFVTLPILYWPILIIILLSYIMLTQLVKTWYIKKFGYN